MNKATWATQDLAVSKIADKITLIKHSVQPKNLSINLQKKKGIYIIPEKQQQLIS